MAQFVVFWSLQCLLIVSSLTLSKANVVVVEQEPTIVPEVVSEAINEVNKDPALLAGVGVGVAAVGGQVMTNEVDPIASQQRAYHPAAVAKPRVIEQYDRRSLDGQYEYRYALSNGETRYERAYWLPTGKNVILARKGYYSHLLKNHKYLTVFYTADQNGFREDSSTYSQSKPTLPRSLKVPEYAPPPPTYAPQTQHPSHPHVHPTTTTRRPHLHATGNPSIHWYTTQVPQANWQSNQVQSSQSSSGVPTSWGTQHLVGSNAIAGPHPSVPSQTWSSSGVYSSPTDIYKQSGVYADSNRGTPLGVSSGAIVDSSSGPQAPTSWGIHTSSGDQSSLGVHIPSVVANSPSTVHHSTVPHHHHSGGHVSPAHSTSNVHYPSTGYIIPSTIRSPSKTPISHHLSTTHKPHSHGSTLVQPITTTTTAPVRSWQYSFQNQNA